ncbi:post-GPI attachment to proteins factor 6 isoform X3 [Monomorium pharaonis]|uniref:post-GPI attachment to proteins factor 6 isoform X3 n=2 Tax=Monomorium pharaonis TaxID=307658 RepID=UPI00063FC401|nr:post-GPI attachment to proteins factor 6 isoform X3 [Monomorium pharaonis]XP_036147031.1 post-GPI attachment to proteins factor 6 isoform X3 [Monomorium pharaonis]XP_036147032.1 post-GPI attachment to proteins factor 6 isoform X3 [Monomorium pharaonis]
MISTCFSKLYSTSHQFSVYLKLLFIFFPMSCSVIPQANQQDLLRSYKSYSDVTMFHYTVPREVIRATWQFAAFMDDPTCHPRKVYIHIRFGSYPIITTDNKVFLMRESTKRDDDIVVTTTTIYQSKNITVVPVYEPQPGDWFVAAYMSYWDEKVQQQGLGHKCQYSIGTIALWSQTDNIVNIPINYQTRLRTSTKTTYYKIYIPSGILSFRVSIWNCSFTLHTVRDIRKPCIEAIYLKGRVLPISNHFHSMESKSLTTNASYSFIESSPYEDSYYYLLIVSNSIIEFNVKIDTSECPIKLTEELFTREYMDIALSFNSMTGMNTYKELIKHKWYYKENNNSRFYNKDEFHQKNEKHETDNLYTKCIPRYQLVRVKHAETFSTVYLLQGKDWLSSRLILTDLIPIMTQFDILPLIDIGGTLEINVHLEVKKLPLTQLVLITMCIQRGRIPKLEDRHSCQNGTVTINLSSLNKRNASSLIAFPQPGTWYIVILATCYKYNKPVRCQMEEMSILLNVRTKKCMFSDENPCGNHGICQEIQKNVLHYATCNCFKGYSGWDCTDISSTMSAISFVSAILLVISNIFFIPAICIAVKQRLYAEGLVYLVTMLFSSLYHACDQSNGQFCITKYEILQYSDFFSSILAFWVTLIAMAELPVAFVPLCHMTGVFVITFSVQIDRMCLINILIPLSLGIIVPILLQIFAHIYRTFQSRKCKTPSRKILLGLLFAIVGLLLYSFIETEKNYQYVHSVWHIIMAISLIFLLPSVKSKQITSPTNASFNDDNESWICKESYGIPTFTIGDQSGKSNDRVNFLHNSSVSEFSNRETSCC